MAIVVLRLLRQLLFRSASDLFKSHLSCLKTTAYILLWFEMFTILTIHWLPKTGGWYVFLGGTADSLAGMTDRKARARATTKARARARTRAKATAKNQE
uniref:Uncharacterized protein n=1 Tax=mine drainage metagenome TaxID=410659 RepID=E6QMI4_9ZZZZ